MSDLLFCQAEEGMPHVAGSSRIQTKKASGTIYTLLEYRARLMPLEILHSALVLLGSGARLESAEVAPLAGLQVHLPRIEPVFA
jgi:hypothetical protein